MKYPLLYLAGIMDVTGQMNMKLQRGVRRPMIDLHGPAARIFAEEFGGNPVRWNKSCTKAQEILRQLRPFMVVRGKVADELLGWKPIVRKSKVRRRVEVPKILQRPNSLGAMLVSMNE